MLKLRKLVTKDWVHVSPGLSGAGGRGGGGECGRPMKSDILFWGIVVGRFKCRKMGLTIKIINSL